MRALLLTEIFPPKTGGSGRWFWELYRRLPARNYLIAAGVELGESADGIDRDRFYCLPLTFQSRLPRWSSVGDYARALVRLATIVRREGIECIHSGRSLPEGLLALAIRLCFAVPYICYVHGEEANFSNATRRPKWFSRRIYGSREVAWFTGLVYQRADRLIANTRSTEDLLVGRWGIDPRRVSVLHPGVDTTMFKPARRCDETRRALGWSGRTVLLTVGRLQKRKGHGVLISALPTLAEAYPDVLYSIVGAGEERKVLDQQVRDVGVSDRVQFLGEINDENLRRCYQQADLFVLPNREINGDIEGFGMVLLEAQACGRPVVAGRSGGTREALVPDKTGWLVNCEDAESLASRLKDILADRRRLNRMGCEGRRWVEANFDWTALSLKASLLFDRCASDAIVEVRREC